MSATFSGTNLRRTRRARCKRDEAAGGEAREVNTGIGVRKFECISRVCNLCADPKPRLMKNKVKNLTPQTFSTLFLTCFPNFSFFPVRPFIPLGCLLGRARVGRTSVFGGHCCSEPDAYECSPHSRDSIKSVFRVLGERHRPTARLEAMYLRCIMDKKKETFSFSPLVAQLRRWTKNSGERMLMYEGV